LLSFKNADIFFEFHIYFKFNYKFIEPKVYGIQK
jgi:hypothetical protein